MLCNEGAEQLHQNQLCQRFFDAGVLQVSSNSNQDALIQTVAAPENYATFRGDECAMKDGLNQIRDDPDYQCQTLANSAIHLVGASMTSYNRPRVNRNHVRSIITIIGCSSYYKVIFNGGNLMPILDHANTLRQEDAVIVQNFVDALTNPHDSRFDHDITLGPGGIYHSMSVDNIVAPFIASGRANNNWLPDLMPGQYPLRRAA